MYSELERLTAVVEFLAATGVIKPAQAKELRRDAEAAETATSAAGGYRTRREVIRREARADAVRALADGEITIERFDEAIAAIETRNTDAESHARDIARAVAGDRRRRISAVLRPLADDLVDALNKRFDENRANAAEIFGMLGDALRADLVVETHLTAEWQELRRLEADYRALWSVVDAAAELGYLPQQRSTLHWALRWRGEPTPDNQARFIDDTTERRLRDYKRHIGFGVHIATNDEAKEIIAAAERQNWESFNG